MRKLFIAHACGVVFFLPALSLIAQTSYFRVANGTNPVPLAISPGGVLSWSNAPLQTAFSVENALDVNGLRWTPWAAGTSTASQVSIKVTDPRPPAGMVYIPGGYFTVGDTLGDLGGIAVPVHRAYVDGFFMQKLEVTNEDARRVLQWALDRGKITMVTSNLVNTEGSPQTLVWMSRWDSVLLLSNGQFSVKPGRGNHPFVYVTWYGAVAFCNYLSQMEGLTPCYNLTNWSCDFSKNGYRLPTEHEWEKAARGGYENTRFPWSDVQTISQSRASYKSATNILYDLGPVPGYNPVGGPTSPFSTAVATFAPNNYGLYDMAGNAWEWCWDWTAKYPYTTQFNPTGPATGTFKVFRGGSWLTTAERLTCAMRYLSASPDGTHDDIGFRMARTDVQ
jgi:formylglycine-generating enzyme required for sulfatase activity